MHQEHSLSDLATTGCLVNELAEKAGINIAKGMAKIYNGRQHTFPSKRFDRAKAGERIHFASAMTLLGQVDGSPGVSYLQFAEFILQNGASPNSDLEELRIVKQPK